MAHKQETEDWVTCPYTPSHRMLRRRLQQHLLKCCRNHPDAAVVKCPFNQSHIVPEAEYEIHCRYCKDRQIIDQYKNSAAAPINLQEFAHAPVHCDENWDDDEAKEYKPQEYALNANVMREPKSFLPSERKQFVKEERKRLGTEYDDETKEKRLKKQSKANKN